MRYLGFLALLELLVIPASAHAACTAPAGAEGTILYNGDFHVMQYCDGTQWQGMSGGGTASGGMVQIATQTASNSATLDFTNLPTSYNTLVLNCSGLRPATSNTGLELQFGQGATPTWQTSNYKWAVSGSYDSGTSPTATGSTSSAYIALVQNGELLNTATQNLVLTAHLYNLPSSTLRKMANYQFAYLDSGGNLNQLTGAGTYTGNTNPVTAVRILAISGNITSGSCTLSGMN